ncbi:MAG: class I SAM-dependent methyltransferase [Halobacteriales archaeon]|nr:class I SAM-dependent methyltransferase [Halobacteriales archaeon]
MALTVEQYLARVEPVGLYARLRVADAGELARNVGHFTDKEAMDRDRIVLDHLGPDGAEAVERAVSEALLEAGAMNREPAILDAGAGSGFFTTRVAERLRAHKLAPRMFAMDATPAMLRALGAKQAPIVPFLGVLEDLEGSAREAAKLQPLPPLFHGLMSTLALHHCPDPARFFAGAARVLQHGAPAVVVDMTEHGHADFRERMGDVHLGFDPQRLAALALDHFAEAEARVLPDVGCRDSGTRVGLFALTLRR